MVDSTLTLTTSYQIFFLTSNINFYFQISNYKFINFDLKFCILPVCCQVKSIQYRIEDTIPIFFGVALIHRYNITILRRRQRSSEIKIKSTGS